MSNRGNSRCFVSRRKVWAVLWLGLLVFLLGPMAAARNAADKAVDSGVFDIYVNGQHIATESFQIRQGATSSTATSEFKLDGSERKSVQKSELQMSAAGDLLRYEWHELGPGKAQLVVEPSNDFLIEHITPDPPARPAEHPFILPVSTMVLDDYVFSQREILVWRYLAQACSGNVKNCRPGKMQFGVLVPQQHTSTMVSLDYAGPEKVAVHGDQRELNRVNMKTDDADWILYLDGNLKLVRITIPSAQTEVVRE